MTATRRPPPYRPPTPTALARPNNALRLGTRMALRPPTDPVRDAMYFPGPHGAFGGGMYFPSVVYKFGQRKYMESLVSLGVLRLGTFREYGKDAHGPRQDRDEGKFVEHHAFTEPTIATVGDPFVGSVFRGYGPGMLQLHNVTIQREHAVPDLLALCTSLDTSAEIDPKYDCCVRISDPFAFVEALSLAIAPHGYFCGADEIAYDERQYEPGGLPMSLSPAFVKTTKHRPEIEWRAIWMPTAMHPKPVVVIAPEVTRYCEIVHGWAATKLNS